MTNQTFHPIIILKYLFFKCQLMKFRHFNHERLIIVAIWVGLIWTLSTLWWELPVQSVVNPTCDKSAHWDDLDDSCKLELYKNWQVTDQAESFSSLIFSALWWASYSNPHSKDVWWHPSLDIATVKWTPVYAISWWSIISASMRNWYWQVITIKHILEDWTTIYSNYSHLNDMYVSKWETIQEWDVIWTVWRTWFSIWKRWNHLDFQITTAESPSHPYWYHDCETAYYDAVETRACEDKLKKYTIDPILFFLEHGNYDLTPLAWKAYAWIKIQEHAIAPEEDNSEEDNTAQEIVNEEENNQIVDELLEQWIIIEKPKQEITIVSDNKISTLLSAIIKNRSSFSRSVFIPLERQYSQFAKDNETRILAWSVQAETEIPVNNSIPYTITWELPTIESGDNRGKIMPLQFTIKDKFWVAFNWTMKEKVHVEFNKEHVSVTPSRFWRIVWWTKNLFLSAERNIDTTITIKYWDTVLGSEVLLYGNN